MNYKFLIIFLIIIGGLGVLWSVSSLFSSKDNSVLVQNQENFERAMQAELADKCKTPEGYSDEEWQAHMSHHPAQYEECLQTIDMTEISRKDIGVEDLQMMLERKDFTLVDVHIPEQAHIPDTDAFIPFNQIADRVGELPADKDAAIVLYCRSGSMSASAAKDLIELGYTNVYNVLGGMNAWQSAGYEVDNTSL